MRALYFGRCFFLNRNSSFVSDTTMAAKITTKPSNVTMPNVIKQFFFIKKLLKPLLF
jgi:hypothetical protein